MEKNDRSALAAIWFSGFFGLGTVVHLIRLILRVPVTLGTWAVPLKASGILVLVFGALSFWMLRAGCGQSCCSSNK